MREAERANGEDVAIEVGRGGGALSGPQGLAGINRRILIVDDNPSIHEDYRKVLLPSNNEGRDTLAKMEADLFGESPNSRPVDSYEIDFAFQGGDALQLVTEAYANDRPYAAAFIDVRMPPGWDGIETAQRFWLADPDLLIVVCSAHSDYSWTELVERLGANDRWLLLKKPFDSIEVRQLAAALTQRWDMARENQAYAHSLEAMVKERTDALNVEMVKLREAEREVSYLAQHDALTSLPNRRFLEAHLKYQVQQAKRHKRGLAIISADLDRFKWINDTLGHAAGDLVLKTVAQRLAASLRESDCVARNSSPPVQAEGGTVARLGGDEFIVVLTDIELPEDVAMVARRITDLMALPIDVEGREITVGASLGIAMQPADGEDPDTLLRKADLALYHAKTCGRNVFRFYTDELRRGADDRLWLEHEIQRALAQGEFTLAFQPEVDTARNVVIGAEALLRWQHPERGWMSPAQFIPVAEETGLIRQLGAWALEQACRHAVRAVAEIPSFDHIAVNVSATQLQDEAFFHIVQHVLDTTGLAPQRLELEITESAFVGQQTEVDTNLRLLKECGVRIALDDFGTGYSSLAHLARWPVDTVKIDRSFVRDLPHNARSLGIVRAIMALAGCFANKVVAEGIELAEQRDALREEGCRVMQGFMLCKPVSFDEFLSFASAHTEPQRRPSLQRMPQVSIAQAQV